MSTAVPAPTTPEHLRDAAAQHMCATALAYLAHDLPVDVIQVDGEGGGYTTGGLRMIDAEDGGRIGMIGAAMTLAWSIERVGQDEAVRRAVTNWRDSIEMLLDDPETYSYDMSDEYDVANTGSLRSNVVWAIAFVESNRELITELAGQLQSAGGSLTAEQFLPMVEGAIQGPTQADELRALSLFVSHLDELDEIELLIYSWRKKTKVVFEDLS